MHDPYFWRIFLNSSVRFLLISEAVKKVASLLCRSQSSKHQASRGGIDEGLGMRWFDFIVFGKPAICPQPCKSSFDNPSLSKNTEAASKPRNNLQVCSLSPEGLANPLNQCTRVTSVSINQTQPPKPFCFLQDQLSTIPILDVRRVDDNRQNHSKSVDQKMSFSPNHLLSSIVAAFSGLLSHFNALRVDDGRCRSFFFPLCCRTLSLKPS